MARVGVTGASGFVGRELIPDLLDAGHEVRGLARHSPNHTGSRATIAGFSFMAEDVRDRSAVSRLVKECDFVIHLAASLSAEDSIEDIVIRSMEAVAGACKESGVRRLVFLSCQGADAASHSPFYAAKWKAEAILRGSGVPYTIIRSSLILGHDDGVVRPLANLIRAMPVVPVPGRGEHRQQPIDVQDVARCIVQAMQDTGLENETVGIGGPTFLTLRQLIDLVGGQLGLARPKLLIPPPVFASLMSSIPAVKRATLFQGARLAQWEHGVVASPGAVQRVFGFEPASIVSRLPGYLV